MTEKDLQIQDLKAENEKLKDELEQLKQPRAAVDTERLTIEYDGHYVLKELCTIDRLGGADDCEPCHENCDKDCGECAVQKCFDKLAEYEDLEEQGLLLKLPCRIGDTVYDIFMGEVKEKKVVAVVYFHSPSVKQITIHASNGRGATTPIELYRFGKTIFLTEQEAQTALEKMKGE